MRGALLFGLLMLAGCAAPYDPIAIEITDPVAYRRHVDFCLAAAEKFRPRISAGSVARGAIEGGSANLSYAPLNPLIPAVGAVGGAAGEAAIGLGITGQSRRNVAKHCLEEKTRRDGSAIVANPDN